MLVINLPNATSGLARRGPAYVSSATFGLIVTPSNYMTQTFTLRPTLSPGCSNASSPPQQYQCPVIAGQGSGVTFTVTATAGGNGTGQQLGTGVSSPMTIALTNAVINLILKAIPATVTTSAPSYIATCMAPIANATIGPLAKDGAAQTINGGNGGDATPSFAAPMTVAVSGNPNVKLSLGATVDVSSLTLNGISDLTSFTVRNTNASLGAATITFTYNSATIGSFTVTDSCT